MALNSIKPKIQLNRQDTYDKEIIIYDDGVLKDCTGWTIWFTVRDSIPATSIVDDTDESVKIHKEIVGSSTGKHSLNLISDDTDLDSGEYFFDISYKKNDGAIKSTPYGYFIINSDITRSS